LGGGGCVSRRGVVMAKKKPKGKFVWKKGDIEIVKRPKQE
jgi:hypothetical protein